MDFFTMTTFSYKRILSLFHFFLPLFYYYFLSIDLQRPCLLLFHLELFLTPPLTETKQLIIKTQYSAKSHILCHEAEDDSHNTPSAPFSCCVFLLFSYPLSVCGTDLLSLTPGVHPSVFLSADAVYVP